MVYNSFTDTKSKKIALLIDPDKHTGDSLTHIARIAQVYKVPFIFVGGSLLVNSIDHTIQIIKAYFQGPVILFPGNACQVSEVADAILFLSLISGRNAEFLIGNHVISAPRIKQSNLEVIPTGYMLIHCGKTTSVEYMSNTTPIPADKPDIAVATAIAGEMLGLRCLYLEGGSGAEQHISADLISKVKKACSIPVIVGGGIRSKESLEQVFDAGADIVVVGTAVEKNISFLQECMAIAEKYNS